MANLSSTLATNNNQTSLDLPHPFGHLALNPFYELGKISWHWENCAEQPQGMIDSSAYLSQVHDSPRQRHK